MGKRSLAEKIFDEYKEQDPGENTWLIIYDFPRVKPTSKFYDNLNRIKTLAEDGQLVQYSVFMTRDQRAAKAMRDLVKHYDGQVMMFRGELADL
jgi:hypothetical protein